MSEGRQIQIKWTVETIEVEEAHVQIWLDGGEGEAVVDGGTAASDNIDLALANVQINVGENLDPLYREAAALGVREFLLHSYDDESLWQVLGFMPDAYYGHSSSAKGKTAAEALRSAIEAERARQRSAALWEAATAIRHAREAVEALDEFPEMEDKLRDLGNTVNAHAQESRA